MATLDLLTTADRRPTIIALAGNGGGAFRFDLIVPHLPAGVQLRAITLPGFAGVPGDPALRTLRDYTLHIIPGWDHYPMYEKPGEYGQEVATLARDLVSKGENMRRVQPRGPRTGEGTDSSLRSEKLGAGSLLRCASAGHRTSSPPGRQRIIRPPATWPRNI